MGIFDWILRKKNIRMPEPEENNADSVANAENVEKNRLQMDSERTEPYFSQIVTFGAGRGEDAEILFFNPEEKLRVALINEKGEICQYPGIAHPDIIRPHFEGRFPVSPVVHYRTEIEKTEDGYILIWEIQPDGRYWADEDGFGMENSDEICLYAKLDTSGAWDGPFRIYNIGRTKFYGTDLEEEKALEI